jgi:hypothetical protein
MKVSHVFKSFKGANEMYLLLVPDAPNARAAQDKIYDRNGE